MNCTQQSMKCTQQYYMLTINTYSKKHKSWARKTHTNCKLGATCLEMRAKDGIGGATYKELQLHAAIYFSLTDVKQL